MGRVYDFFASFGAKKEITDVAVTQNVPGNSSDIDRKGADAISIENITGYQAKVKAKRLDRWLDWVVVASGSQGVFFTIMILLFAWAFLGIPYGKTANWAVIISDVQAILNYMFDSLLMRQQLNGYEKIVAATAAVRSRIASHKRMLRTIEASGQYEVPTAEEIDALAQRQNQFSLELPKENWLSRVSNAASVFLGHLITVIGFWVCIGIWLAFGPSLGWSDQWQLYINSATSALMVLIFTFLANIRERHNIYVEQCLHSLFQVDSAVELKLRIMTGDEIPNQPVTIPAPKMGRVQRGIFYYSDFVGTLTGIAILIVVMVVWLAIGPVMHFNDNWWLLIGTYAGLIGLNDGFVLRNVAYYLCLYEEEAFAEADLEEKAVFDDIRVADPARPHQQAKSLTNRLSLWMGYICSHEVTVVLGFLFIVALLAGTTAMKWSTTGQLLCNIPPSIVESFFMMILITGHNLAEEKRRMDIYNMYLRRLKLLAYIDGLKSKSDVTTVVQHFSEKTA